MQITQFTQITQFSTDDRSVHRSSKALSPWRASRIARVAPAVLLMLVTSCLLGLPEAVAGSRAGGSLSERGTTSTAPTAQTGRLGAPSQRRSEGGFDRQAQANAESPSSGRYVIGNTSRRALPLRLEVGETGLYFVSDAEISAIWSRSSGTIRNAITNGRLGLSHRGEPVHWYPASNGEGFYFYAEAIDSPYTETDYYWLEMGYGERMWESGVPAAPATASRYRATERFEEDLLATTLLPDQAADRMWFWHYISPNYPPFATVTVQVSAEAAVYDGRDGVLRIEVQAMNSSAEAPDHGFRAVWNGVEIGERSWDNRDRQVLEIAVPASLVQAGSNTLELTGFMPNGVLSSAWLLDKVELEYSRSHETAGEDLGFHSDDYGRATLSGFIGSDVLLLDVTDAAQPRHLTGPGAAVDGTGALSVAGLDPTRDYYAARLSAASAPLSVTPRDRSPLLDDLLGAEYVVVVPDSFTAGGEALAAYRQGRGLTTKVVLLQDLYDAFDWGLPTPDAVAGFIRYAWENWSQQPRYVALAGAGTYDYRDLSGHGGNLIPPQMVATPFGLYATDMVYADVEDGEFPAPELIVGRIPVRTNDELLAYTARLEAGEALGAANRAAFMADNPDAVGDFPEDSGHLSTLMPPQTAIDTISLAAEPVASARSRLSQALFEGVDWVSYVGHGGVDRMASEAFVLASDAETWNVYGSPLWISLTCNVGRFGIPGFASLAESLVLAESGAAGAVFAPAGLSVHVEAMALGEELYGAFGGEAHDRIGDAVFAALQAYGPQIQLQYLWTIYNIIGDPAFELK